MFCSLFFASLVCFQQPVVSEPIIYEHKAIATAYNLETSQTDEEPCIGAGTMICVGSKKRTPVSVLSLPGCMIFIRSSMLKKVGRCEVLDRTSPKNMGQN